MRKRDVLQRDEDVSEQGLRRTQMQDDKPEKRWTTTRHVNSISSLVMLTISVSHDNHTLKNSSCKIAFKRAESSGQRQNLVQRFSTTAHERGLKTKNAGKHSSYSFLYISFS